MRGHTEDRGGTAGGTSRMEIFVSSSLEQVLHRGMICDPFVTLPIQMLTFQEPLKKKTCN